MRRILICLTGLLLRATSVVAQATPSDSQMTQAVLSEIRQLRQDLQATAAIMQRVQIVLYRLQAQESQLDRATQRFETARDVCKGAEMQRKQFAAQIEQAESAKRSAQNASDRQAAEETLARLRSSAEMFSSEVGDCQGNQVDAEIHVRAEQAKMSELQDQLERLDKVLPGDSRR
jgi:chromosome segregation ATPase